MCKVGRVGSAIRASGAVAVMTDWKRAVGGAGCGRQMGVLEGALMVRAAGRPIREHVSIKKTEKDI